MTSLRADLELVVNNAARLQEGRERRPGSGSEALSPFEPELSGHSVLESVALNWRIRYLLGNPRSMYSFGHLAVLFLVRDCFDRMLGSDSRRAES